MHVFDFDLVGGCSEFWECDGLLFQCTDWSTQAVDCFLNKDEYLLANHQKVKFQVWSKA